MATGEMGDAANVAQDTDQRRGRIPADTFSNRLILSRALAGHISIREACERTGLNRGNWQGWERGLRPRDQIEVCRAIADALEIDFNWLLLGGGLAGPRGREVRPVAKRVREDTDRYPRSAVRPSSARPKPGRPNNRRETHVSHTVRPTVVEHPTAAGSDLVTATR